MTPVVVPSITVGTRLTRRRFVGGFSSPWVEEASLKTQNKRVEFCRQLFPVPSSTFLEGGDWPNQE